MPAPCPYFQLPLADEACRTWVNVGHLATRRHRFIDGRKAQGGSLAGATAIQDGAAQLLRHRLVGLAERPEPLQQDESLHLLGEDPGIGGGDQGPEGVAKQREGRPARRLSDLVEIVQPVDKDIGRALVIRATVPRQIDADQLKVGQIGARGTKLALLSSQPCSATSKGLLVCSSGIG